MYFTAGSALADHMGFGAKCCECYIMHILTVMAGCTKLGTNWMADTCSTIMLPVQSCAIVVIVAFWR